MMVAGIDYSMSCPAMTIGETGCGFDEVTLYSYKTKKRHSSVKQQIVLFDYPTYTDDIDRFEKLATTFTDIMVKRGVKKVFLEGYSYGSKTSGKVFEIAENTAILKHFIRKHGIELVLVSPSQVKQDFTSRGDASKGVMYMSFRDKHCPYEIHDAIGEPIPEKIGSPVSDLIDSYALWRFGLKG